MLSKKAKLRGIGPKLIFWTTILLIISMMSVSVTIYYLLSNSLRQSDKNLIYRLKESYAKSYNERNLSKLSEEISPELYVAFISSDGKVLFESLPKYVDHDFEDEDEIRQLKEGVNKIVLEEGWSTVLLLSGEEDNDLYQKLEHQVRLLVWKKEWLSILPLIDNDMFEVYVVPIGNGNWMKIGKSSEEREENLSSVRYITVLVLIPFIFIGIFLSFFIARSILAPIKRLASTMSSIKHGQTHLRGELRNAGDEVDLLTEEFNSLLDKNEALIEGIKSTVDNVAHDLRTPLTRFKISAENALLNETEPEKLKEALEDGLENSDQILRLLNAIMDVSEAESGTMKIRSAPVNLADLLKNMIEIFHYAAEDRQIKIEANFIENVFVSGDETRLLQAFSNILDNAVKYSSDNSTVEISMEISGRDVLIKIKDSGMGIEESDLNRIWDRLYRADKSRSTSGLGLGLSVVKAIIKVHNGRIDVSSTPGKGSVFSITLPICNDPVRPS